jgi:hypothetical protein
MAFQRKKKMLREIIFEKAKKRGLNDDEALHLCNLLIAQAKHETGNFNSNIYKFAHNLFGMKLSSRKVATESYAGHAKYKSDQDSIEDMLQYLESGRVYTLANVSVMEPLQYVLYLKSRKYFEDTVTNYFNGVSKFYKKVSQV